MTGWDDVLAIADPTVEPTIDDELLILSAGDDRNTVVARIQELFGRDERRSALRLIVAGTDRGVLGREDAYALAPPSDRGTFGVGDYLRVPGYSVDFEILRLRCPSPGCHVHASVMSVPDPPPLCPLHGLPLVNSG
jgi:hypothetical protein